MERTLERCNAAVLTRIDLCDESGHTRAMNSGTFFFVVYVCVMVGVGLYVLSLLSRFVKAHERMASALERNSDGRRSGQ